jgi:hypothetical protein
MTPDQFQAALNKQNGPKEVTIGTGQTAVTFPVEMLGDIVPNYTGGTTESTTQGGTRRRPSGRPDTAEVAITFFLAGPESVKAIYQALYSAPTEGSDTGTITWGAGGCISDAPTQPLLIHPVCEANDDFDIRVFSVTLPDTFNPTLAADGSDATLELTFQMNKTDQGYFQFGPAITTS